MYKYMRTSSVFFLAFLLFSIFWVLRATQKHMRTADNFHFPRERIHWLCVCVCAHYTHNFFFATTPYQKFPSNFSRFLFHYFSRMRVIYTRVYDGV